MDTTESHSQVRSTSVVNDVDLPGRGRCRVRRLHGPPNAPTVLEGDHAVCAISPARFLPAMLAALDNVAGRALAVSAGAGRAEPMVA
jgi:hypothetical protein